MGSVIFVEGAKKISRFDYCFKLDEKNCPNTILLMTPTMRCNLLRFGNIIYLDGM